MDDAAREVWFGTQRVWNLVFVVDLVDVFHDKGIVELNVGIADKFASSESCKTRPKKTVDATLGCGIVRRAT